MKFIFFSSRRRHTRLVSDGVQTCALPIYVYASAFAGAYLAGIDVNEAAKIAADFTVESIEATQTEKNHWYGVKFEPLLGKLAARVVSN